MEVNYPMHEEGCCVFPAECLQKPSKHEEGNGGEGHLTVCNVTDADAVPRQPKSRQRPPTTAETPFDQLDHSKTPPSRHVSPTEAPTWTYGTGGAVTALKGVRQPRPCFEAMVRINPVNFGLGTMAPTYLD